MNRLIDTFPPTYVFRIWSSTVDHLNKSFTVDQYLKIIKNSNK